MDEFEGDHESPQDQTLQDSAPATEGGAIVSRNTGVSYRLGGGVYAMHTNPKCYVCNSDWRVDIETMVLRGYGYPTIAQRLPPGQPILGKEVTISARNIQDHANNHMPMEKIAQRATLDIRMIELNRALDEAEGSLVDQQVFLKDLVRRGYEAMSDGRLGFGVRDVIRAATVLMRAEQDANQNEGGVSIDDMTEAFAEYGNMTIEIFRRMESGEFTTADEASRAMGRAINSNVALQALSDRIKMRQSEQQALPPASE